MTSIGVIIPFYNRWDLTHNRLYELYRFAPVNTIEIFLVNDGSTDRDCEDGIAWWKQDMTRNPIHYHKNKENMGFGYSMNIGSKMAIKAGMDTLIFLSNDVVMSADVITSTVNLVNSSEKCLVGNELVNQNAGWNAFKFGGKDFFVPWLNGWYLACSSKNWSSLKGFDWRTYGKYTFEDIDLSTKALLDGFSLLPLNSFSLRHLGGQTAVYTQERHNITAQNREKYIEKWRSKFDVLCNISI